MWWFWAQDEAEIEQHARMHLVTALTWCFLGLYCTNSDLKFGSGVWAETGNERLAQRSTKSCLGIKNKTHKKRPREKEGKLLGRGVQRVRVHCTKRPREAPRVTSKRWDRAEWTRPPHWALSIARSDEWKQGTKACDWPKWKGGRLCQQAIDT
ncbi:hypothetical protein F5144DRAFT_543894 [Chaetomium tenue]|uniref:Uncharacterized protein n=1 Tax=Chaetomium tenue TaxID=1854479 RepID=A0ACB7PR91_9PEZI|nr:hypothetical protein F5144DRAFT_543894 [Chaetomium globosum]